MFQTRRTNRKTIRTRSHALQHECLEPRLALDGDVSVRFDGKDWLIRGDEADNELRIEVIGGNVTVVGENNTTLNGGTGPVTLATGSSRIPRSLGIRLNDGDDRLTLDGIVVSDLINLRGGDGDDFFEIRGTRSRRIELRGQAGDDVVDLQGARTTKWTGFRMGDGDDTVAVNDLRTGSGVGIRGGNGDDTIATIGMTVGDKIDMVLGSGDDQAAWLGQTRVAKKTNVGLGAGDDFFGILPDREQEDGRFQKRMNVFLGDGNDVFASDAGLRSQRLNLNGGRGSDTYDLGGSTVRSRTRSIENEGVDNLEQSIDAIFAQLGAVGIDTAPFGDDGSQNLGLETSPTALDYTEGDGAVPLDAGVAVEGSETVTGATISFESGYDAAQDELLFTNQNGIVGSFDAALGVLTLSGEATAAQYESALRSVRYQNISDDPSSEDRLVTINIVDNAGTMVEAQRTVEVEPVNDAPIITLGSDQIDVSPEELPTVIDDGVVLEDLDDDDLVSVTVTISSGYVMGADELTVNELPSGLSAEFDVATGELVISGTGSVSDFQAALRSLTFTTDLNDPSAGARVLTVTADDGEDVGTAMVTVEVGGEAPVITVANEPLAYTENDGAVSIDTTLELSDADSAVLVSATVQISTGYVAGEDRLVFQNQSGIAGTFDETTGTLTLIGEATIAEYEAALRSVTYENLSDDPSEENRTVTFNANDGLTVGTASRDVRVTAVNDPVDLIVPASVPANGTVTVERGDEPITLEFSVEDLDDSQFTYQLDLEASGLGGDVALPTIDSAGVFTWTPETAGVFEIRILVINESGQADQETVTFEIL